MVESKENLRGKQRGDTYSKSLTFVTRGRRRDHGMNEKARCGGGDIRKWKHRQKLGLPMGLGGRQAPIWATSKPVDGLVASGKL